MVISIKQNHSWIIVLKWDCGICVSILIHDMVNLSINYSLLTMTKTFLHHNWNLNLLQILQTCKLWVLKKSSNCSWWTTNSSHAPYVDFFPIQCDMTITCSFIHKMKQESCKFDNIIMSILIWIWASASLGFRVQLVTSLCRWSQKVVHICM